MTHHTPQSLLSLPPDAAAPEAYRVLGLGRMESDRAKIKAAADAAMARLSAAKVNADHEAWETAVTWVKNAYAILGDPGKKAAYDRKLAAEAPQPAPAIDPLAGLLPGTAGRPAFHPGHAPQTQLPFSGQPSAAAAPNMVARHPGLSAVASEAPAGEIKIPVVTGRKPLKRRRGLPWLPILVSVFSLATIAGLVALIYVVQNGNPVVVRTGGGPFIGSDADPDGDGRAVSAPMALSEQERRPPDPVMGEFAGDMLPPTMPETVDTPGVSSPSPTAASIANVSETRNDSLPATAADVTAPPRSPETVVTPDSAAAPPVPNPPMTNVPPEPTAEQIQAGDMALAAVTAAIKGQQWDKLKSLSETALAAAVNEPQRELAENLSQLVDLAVYYRGGIERSVATLQAGNELDLSADLKVVIVEADPDKLIISFNGRNKAYTFDEIPLSLAHKLAQQSMPGDSPTTRAAKYAFQAIAPVTTPPYRDEAIAELENIEGAVEGAETARLVAAIRHLYEP